MTILCATDFSEQARAAEQTAAALASKWKLPLVLLHVDEPAATDAARAQALLSERAAALTVPSIEKVIEKGPAHEVIQRVALARKARLIVVGSHGHRLEPLFRLGGTSDRLSQSPTIPTLIVREGESVPLWAQGAPLRVTLGVDDGAACAAAVRWLSALRELAPVDVVVARVYYADEAHHLYGVAGRRFSYTDPDPIVERFIERDLKRLVPSLPGKGELFFRAKLGLGRMGDHLLEVAEAERCQMVVVGTPAHGRLSRLWSVSAVAAHFARMSVALIPPEATDTAAFRPAPRFKRVLVTTDFSPLGNAAIAWAGRLIEPGGELTLAHVTPVEGIAGQLADLYAPELPIPHASPRVTAELAARLQALVPPALSERGVTTRTEVLRAADVAPALVALSEQLGSDAIVMSSHGRSGLSRAIRGSTAEAVLRAAHRPVLVVR
ncbi:MAG: universal stress protein [Archangium sp.]|nr:universal stress protein [Archangium sp.]